jgi:hypothetical protein
MLQRELHPVQLLFDLLKSHPANRALLAQGPEMLPLGGHRRAHDGRTGSSTTVGVPGKSAIPAPASARSAG